MSACSHPKSAQYAGTVLPVEPDGWSPDPFDHVWVGCTRCGEIIRWAPYALELQDEATRGLPRPTPAEA